MFKVQIKRKSGRNWLSVASYLLPVAGSLFPGKRSGNPDCGQNDRNSSQATGNRYLVAVLRPVFPKISPVLKLPYYPSFPYLCSRNRKFWLKALVKRCKSKP